jgi:Helix-turn-helix domain
MSSRRGTHADQPAGSYARGSAAAARGDGASPGVVGLPEGEMFSIEQLSKILRCNRQHIVALVEEGELVAYDLRGKDSGRSCVRVLRDSVISFLRASDIVLRRGRSPSPRK